jgi:hypothetical protein
MLTSFTRADQTPLLPKLVMRLAQPAWRHHVFRSHCVLVSVWVFGSLFSLQLGSRSIQGVDRGLEGA